MNTKTRMLRRGFTLVELLVVIAIIATLAGVGVPALLKRTKDGHRAKAIMNLKQIASAMFSFEQEYGAFPDEDSAADIQENLEETIPGSAGKSNYYFRQLIVSGVIDQEKPFYAKSSYTKKEPDNSMEGDDMLEAGEVAFAYIMKSDDSALGSSSGNSAMPIVVGVLKEGSTDDTFDSEAFNQKAVVLRVDQSATDLTIRKKDNKVSVGNGKTLLQTGTGSVWESGDIEPKIVPPEYP